LKKRDTKIVLIAIVVVQLCGMVLIDLREHDATQYATLSMQILKNNSWLQAYWRYVSSSR